MCIFCGRPTFICRYRCLSLLDISLSSDFQFIKSKLEYEMFSLEGLTIEFEFNYREKKKSIRGNLLVLLVLLRNVYV